MAADRPKPADPQTPPIWNSRWRVVVSGLIAFHLVAVIYAPLTIDRGFDALLGPLQFLRGYATAMYLDHGYRFFAPDPGPTHTIAVEFVDQHGEPQQRRFPDRRSTWPRLLYHRWFMLGETLAYEVNFGIAQAGDYHRIQADLEREINDLNSRGRLPESQLLRQIKADNQRQFERHRELLVLLVDAIRSDLTPRLGGFPLKILSRRQLIPTPQDIRIHKPIDRDDLVEYIDLSDLPRTFATIDPEVIDPPQEPNP